MQKEKQPKKFELLTDEELINLTEEQIDWYIALKKAEKGIRILKCPESPKYREIPEPNFTVYGILDLYFKDREIAQEISDFINERIEKSYTSNYDWSIDSNKCYANLFNGHLKQVEVKTLYDKDTYNSIKDILISNKKIKEAYEKIKDEYDEYNENVQELVNEIYDKINEAKKRKEDFNEYLVKIQEYLQLANGDKDVAWKFFNKAYTIENTVKNKIIEHEDYLETLKGY